MIRTANTRMRDFYDIHVISEQQKVDTELLRKAFLATSEKRNTTGQIPDFQAILLAVASDDAMEAQWENFRASSFFVGELVWNDVMASVEALASKIL